MTRKRMAIAGTGARSFCFAKAVINEYGDGAELVALFDRNPLRIDGFNRLLKARIPGFTDFARMASETKPTHLVIGTPDHTHDTFIEQAFAHGMEVICEKPLTTDPAKLRRILAAEKRYGRTTIVAFNYRYAPYAARVKQLLREGDFGRILSVTLDWHLDRLHGTEYFRRWHAHMACSGGLLVHKATHHFDLVNWLLDDEPAEVAAFGALHVFGRNGRIRGERCSTCPHAEGACVYAMKTHKVEADRELFDRLYWNAEPGDGYIRDRCVFREDIDIYDTMSVLVRYRGGAQLAYALTAYAAYEGYELRITTEGGRIEATERHGGIFMYAEEERQIIRVIRGSDRNDQTREDIEVDADHGAHGGGDTRMYRRLFRGDLPDPLGQSADSRAGALSCAVGMAANQSIAARRPVTIAEILGG